MANGQFITLENGKRVLRTAAATSAGTADGNKIVQTDASGKIDPTFLPDLDTASKVAGEALSAGDFVHIDGTGQLVKADATNGRPAHGFIKEAIANGATGVVNYEGTNAALSSLTPGARYYLDAAGAVTATPKTASGEIHQFLGTACTASELTTEIADCISIL